MSNWKFIVDYFNSKNAGKIFTRAEVLAYFEKHGKNLKINTLQTYINSLKRAGYLVAEEPGVYRKTMKIPKVSEKALVRYFNHKLFTGRRKRTY